MNTRWTTTTKLVVLVCVLVVGAWLLMRFGEAVPPLLLAFVLAYLLKAPTDGLVRRTGLPRGWAAAIVLTGVIVLLALAPVLITPSLAALVGRLQAESAALAPFLERLGDRVVELGPITLRGSDLVPQLIQGLQTLITPAAGSLVSVVSGIASSVLWVLFVLVLVFWLLKDSHKLRNWLLEQTPAPQREELAEILRRLGFIWGSFFRGQVLVALLVGVIVGLGLWVLGLSNVLLLAILAGLGEFVPTIGPLLATIPALLVAFFGGSSWLPLSKPVVTLIVLLFYLLVFQLDQVYLLPRVMGRRVQLHPALIFAGIVIGAVEFGIWGVLLAAPLLATVRLLGGYVYARLLDREPFPPAPSVVERRGFVRGQPVAGILFDLDGTLADTDDTLIAELAARLGRWRRLFPQGDPRPFLRHLVVMAEGPVNGLITQLDRLGLDDEAFRLSRWFARLLGQRRAEDMVLIPGVEATLQRLKPTYRLALVTTRDREAVGHFLQRNGLADLFDAVVTRDDVRRLKPHPEPVILAAQRLGLTPQECLMVGDTAVDIQAGGAAGARTVGVLCGFGQERDLADADRVLPTTADLDGLL
ncbi:MAG: AI-2E family transporter [Anaerolineae bacterium]|nr:AI-2E family transporter [Caldilineales bacterium]MDW8268887.1 AI-2E family transporter [Anaerolineae bacterium]